MKQAMGGSARTRSNFAAWVLLILVVIAVLVRLPGHFYPVPLHFDEGLEVWVVISCFPPCGGAAHPFLNRYLLFIAEGFYFVVGWATGAFGGIADLREAFATDPSGLLHAGRTVPLVAGVATVPLTYLLGRQIWDRTVGLAGALLVAVSPQLIIVSNNLRSWSLGTFLATLALLLLVRAATSTRRRDAFAAGAAVGAAIAAVYVLGLLLLPSTIALLLRRRALPAHGAYRHLMADFAAAAAGVAVAFLIGNLTGFQRLHQGIDELSYFSARDSVFGSNVDYLTNLSWYFNSLFESYGMGMVLASLAMIGLVWCAWHGRPTSWIPLSFAGAVLVIQPLALFLWAGRYAAPAYPVLLLASSALVVDVSRYLTLRFSRKPRAQVPRALVTVAVLVAAAGSNLEALLSHGEALLRPPTRQLAREWIERNLPEGSRLVLNIAFMSPVLLDCDEHQGGRRQRHPCYDVAYLALPHSTGGALDPAAETARRSLVELSDEGLEYIIYTDPVPPASRARFGWPHWQETFLDENYELLAEFFYRDLIDVPDDTATTNPKVKIYRVRNARSSSKQPNHQLPRADARRRGVLGRAMSELQRRERSDRHRIDLASPLPQSGSRCRRSTPGPASASTAERRIRLGRGRRTGDCHV